MIPREIGVVLALVAVQVLWSQIYPLLKPLAPEGAAAPPSKPATPHKTAEQLQGEIQSELKWLPPLDPHAPEHIVASEDDGAVLPLFPLGTVFYAPFSSGVQLKVFEPRYRQLFDDVMSRPSPRFVVTAIDPDTERLAEVGVVFRVDNLTDIAARTGDQMKYVAKHTVVERVRIRQVLNPHAWKDASTYLRVDVKRLEEAFDPDDLAGLEKDVLATFRKVTEAVLSARYGHLEASRNGLWELADVWINQYLPSRLSVLQGQLQQELRQLSPAEAAQRSQELRQRELSAWRHTVNDQLRLGQRLLQSTSHKQRLEAFFEAAQPYLHAETSAR